MIIVFISVNASCLPTHALDPALKFIQLQGGGVIISPFSLINLYGLKSLGFLYIYYLQWTGIVWVLMIVPFVIGMEQLELTFRKWSYRATLGKIPLADEYILRLYIMTASRQVHFLINSQLRTFISGMFCYSYCFSFSRTLGFLMRQQMAIRELSEVVSVPATYKPPNTSHK